MPSFITKTREHLATVAPRVQANYLVWRLVMQSVSYLNIKAHDLVLQFDEVLYGVSKKPPRWQAKTQKPFNFNYGQVF